MARNNFQYEKRQRELDKKRKADDKAKRKLENKDEAASDGTVAAQGNDDADAGASTTDSVTAVADDEARAPASLPASQA